MFHIHKFDPIPKHLLKYKEEDEHMKMLSSTNSSCPGGAVNELFLTSNPSVPGSILNRIDGVQIKILVVFHDIGATVFRWDFKLRYHVSMLLPSTLKHQMTE